MRRVTVRESSCRPTLDFVLPGLLRGTVGLIVGQGAVGKSFFAIQLALGVALGRPIGSGEDGEIYSAPTRGPTVCIFGEDPPPILQDRLYALHRMLSPEELAEADRWAEFHSATEVGDDLRLVMKVAGGTYGQGPFFARLAEIAAGKRLVVLDPLAFFIAGADENDNGAMTFFMRTLAAVAERSGAAIIVLHHVGKSRDGGEDWEKSRGASSLTTAARLQLNLRLPTIQECRDYGIEDGERGEWVRVSQAKANYSRVRPDLWVRRGADGLLRAGDPRAGDQSSSRPNFFKGQGRKIRA
jgi:regulatory protein RepA